MNTQFKAFRGKTYTLEATFPTNISAEYLNDSGSYWGVWEMLRESIQNMMDEAEYQADNHGGELLDHLQIIHYSKSSAAKYNERPYLEFRDKGRGVDWERIFLIGESGKRGSQYRGQKGEGEALSFLVAARNDIGKIMFSQDWAVMARLDCYEGSAYKVLVFDLYRANQPITGTVWRYYTDNCDEIADYYNNLGSYFPQLSRREQRRQDSERRQRDERNLKSAKKYAQQRERERKAKSTSSNRLIITPINNQNSRLYVRGIYVKDIYSLFSYNLQNVEINRDRSMVDEWQILSEIEKAFNSDDLTLQQAVNYWKHAEDKVGDAGLMEYKTIINFSNNRELMTKAFYQAFGKKACTFTDKAASLDATSLGYKVVDLHPYVRDTARELGIRTDRYAVGYEGDILPMKAPSNKVKSLIAKLQEIGKGLGFTRHPVVPALKKLGTNGNDRGWAQGGTVYLLKHTLEGDRLRLLRTYIHECGHVESGASDATREFTQWFEEMLINALVGRYNGVRELIDELIQI